MEPLDPTVPVLEPQPEETEVSPPASPIAAQEYSAIPAASALRENLSLLVSTAVLAIFFTTFLAQAFEIPSESMEDTLLVGDRPFVNKLTFAPKSRWLGSLVPYREIRRGDIIIFKHPAEPSRIHMVKRVIGLPGDRVRIAHREVYVNGRLLTEPYRLEKMESSEPFRDDFPAPPQGQLYREWRERIAKHVSGGELRVPEGHYFALGDNRDLSLDSRYWGFVPRENILGRPLLLYWSMDNTRADYQSVSLKDRVVGTARTLMHLPSRTRWSRLFRTFPPVEP